MLVVKEKEKSCLKIALSELLYLCFWSLMLFAKGIGLYDGQGAYKVFLVVSFLCILCKMCITEYSYKEWGAIILLMALATVVYRVSGEKGVLICMVTVLAMKNVSVERAFKSGLVVWTVAMGGRFLASLVCIREVQTAVQTKNVIGAVLRYFMGYPHPNILHISYLILTAFVIYCMKDTYDWKHFFVMLIGNLFLFFYSYSFTGTLIVMGYLLLSYYVRKRKISKAEYFLVRLVFPFLVLFSIILPMILNGKAFELADKIFNNRIHLAKHFLTLENMSLFGNNLAALTTDVITMDNAYVFALVVYGIPIFLLICAGYLMTVEIYIKRKRNMELAMICCFLLAGITEPFLFNTSFKNLTLLFLGEIFFVLMGEKRKTQKEVALFKGADKEISISFKKLQKIVECLWCVWSMNKKKILRIGLAGSLVVSILGAIFYRIRPEVIEMQKDYLLMFERIRIMVTVFTMSFFVIIIVSMIYGIILKKD